MRLSKILVANLLILLFGLLLIVAINLQNIILIIISDGFFFALIGALDTWKEIKYKEDNF